MLRKHGTERAFTSPLDKEYGAGMYNCAGCDLPLFSSTTKFDSRTGWPSFYQPLDNAIGTTTDRAWGTGRRCTAALRAISATCSTMGPSPPACATA